MKSQQRCARSATAVRCPHKAGPHVRGVGRLVSRCFSCTLTSEVFDSCHVRSLTRKCSLLHTYSIHNFNKHLVNPTLVPPSPSR